MTVHHSDAQPPKWAEALLRVLLEPKDRKSVSGDLLEEYRETVVPTLGQHAANRWYVRQVGFFVLRATWGWSLLFGFALIIRYLFDTLMPPTDYRMRAAFLSYTIIGACLSAGFTAAWRTRTVAGGMLTAFGAAAIGSIFSIVGTAVMLVVWHDPATLDAWRNSGGLEEAFVDVPVKVMALGAILGLAGALMGKGLSIGRGSRDALKGC